MKIHIQTDVTLKKVVDIPMENGRLPHNLIRVDLGFDSFDIEIPEGSYPTREELMGPYVLTIKAKKKTRVAWFVKSGDQWRTGMSKFSLFTDNKSKRFEFTSRDHAWEHVKKCGGRVVKVKIPV